MKKLFFIIILLFYFLSSISFAKDISWRKVFYEDTLLFVGIENSDSLFCMAVASISNTGTAILKSTDMGETWFQVYRDSNWSKDPQDISYPTRGFCIVGLESNSFRKTTDGGNTWSEYKINLPDYSFGFNDVDMYDENNGVMKQQRYIVISHDGFKTWDTIPSPDGLYIFYIEMPAPNSICLLSRYKDSSSKNNVRFYRSDDGGENWNGYPHPFFIPQKLQFVDSLIGYVAGMKGAGHGDEQINLVYKTTDGGRSWDNVLDTETYVSFGLQKLDFYDKDNGIAVGQFGTIFWTHDGGKTWIFDSSADIWNTAPATMNVCYIRKDRAIIADFRGRIFISEDTTTDVIEEIPSGDDFVIFPNTASDKIKIRLKDEYINTKAIQIFNSYGQEIINKSSYDFRLMTNDFRLLELDVSSLSNGVYFAMLSGNGKVKTIPFVVMR